MAPTTAPVPVAEKPKPLPIVTTPPGGETDTEPMPVSAPKQFVRQKVDIEELRRSINESLKKQTGTETASPEEKAKQ
jgi:hypothetical protein